MDEAPEVTVLMPVRNGAGTVRAAAESILGQEGVSFELLIVDDGSTDGTGAVLAALAGEDARVRVVRQGAAGLVAALNRGMGEARGALVARMDADDLSRPGRLAAQAAALAGAPGVALVGSGWRVFGPDGATRREVRPPRGDAALRAGMRERNVLAHPTVMMRREAAERVGLYRAAFLRAEDYDLWLRLMDRWELLCVPEVLLDYREHAGQVAWQGLEQRILSEMGALAAHDRRQAGRADLGGGPSPISREWLGKMGVPAAEVSAGVIARALGAAKDARAAGLGRAAREAALLGMREPGLSARTRGHFAMLWAGLG